jgi:iron complex transport system permease protein
VRGPIWFSSAARIGPALSTHARLDLLAWYRISDTIALFARESDQCALHKGLQLWSCRSHILHRLPCRVVETGNKAPAAPHSAPPAVGSGLGRNRPGRLVAGLTAALIILSILSLLIGVARLSGKDLVEGLVYGNGISGIIIREIRLPRLLLSITVGAVLGLSGAAMQGLLRNPLAEPAVFGAPQAAAFAAVCVLYSGFADVYSLLLPLAAIAGAFLSVALILLVAGRRADLLSLLLAGLAISSLAAAATSLAINLSANPFAVTEIVFWLMGSFEDRTMRHVLLAAPFIGIGCVILLKCARGYRALSLGEDTAASLGIDLARVKAMTVLGVAIGVGASVAVSGAIGFIGLVAPHMVRHAMGGDPGKILVPSALTGAVLLTAADITVRLIPATSEIKVGVLTALLGVPLFLYLILSRRVMVEGDTG